MTEYNCLGMLMKTKNWIVCKNYDYAIQIEKIKEYANLRMIKKLIFLQTHRIQMIHRIDFHDLKIFFYMCT